MYKQIVGGLIYLTLIRSDIAFAIRVASCFIQNPKNPHLKAIKRILRYIRGILDLSLFCKSKIDCKLERYCDTDYVGDFDTRSSTIGYIFSLDSGAVTLCCKRQPIVSLSTTEVEY